MVVPGYWDNAGGDGARAFVAGFWHSGDLGSVDAEGYVRVFDRKKDMINRGGYKVYSVEVENVLMAYPGVVEAAVVGAALSGARRARARLRASPRRRARRRRALRAFCAERLADYKVPETHHLRRRAAAAQRQRQGDEARPARGARRIGCRSGYGCVRRQLVGLSSRDGAQV